MPRRLERAALAALGVGAWALRRLRLERALVAARDGVDSLFVRAGRPPLRTHIGAVELRGFLRHRSFLADVTADEHEPFLREVLLGELRAETLFVDVGAHVGLYTLLAAGRVERVVAFEADPYTVRALAVNVARSGARNVRVVGKAATDHVGTVGFWQSSGTYSSSLVRRPDWMTERRVEVEATTIDAEIPEAATDVVVKIDAEGAELQVLAGLTRLVGSAARAVLLVESNPAALAEAGSAPDDLVAALRALGLVLHRIDERSRTVVPLGSEPIGDWKGNLLCRSPAPV
jgi:FkbM family methyltransferase